MKRPEKALTPCDDKVCTFFSHDDSRDNTFHGQDGRENRFYGGERNDTFYGGDGDNIFRGHGGNDTFYGGTGRNFFFGGDGNDTFYIRGTYNKVTGGSGKDKCVISSFLPMTSETTIIDFDVATKESIDLRHLPNIKRFEDLKISSFEKDTKIALSDNQVIILKNIKPSDLTKNHFIFNNTNFINETAHFFISEAAVISKEIEEFLTDLTPDVIDHGDGWFF